MPEPVVPERERGGQGILRHFVARPGSHGAPRPEPPSQIELRVESPSIGLAALEQVEVRRGGGVAALIAGIARSRVTGSAWPEPDPDHVDIEPGLQGGEYAIVGV